MLRHEGVGRQGRLRDITVLGDRFAMTGQLGRAVACVALLDRGVFHDSLQHMFRVVHVDKGSLNFFHQLFPGVLGVSDRDCICRGYPLRGTGLVVEIVLIRSVAFSESVEVIQESLLASRMGPASILGEVLPRVDAGCSRFSIGVLQNSFFHLQLW